MLDMLLCGLKTLVYRTVEQLAHSRWSQPGVYREHLAHWVQTAEMRREAVLDAVLATEEITVPGFRLDDLHRLLLRHRVR